MQDQSATGNPSFKAAILLLVSEPVVRLVMREALDHAGYFVMEPETSARRWIGFTRPSRIF